MANDNVAQFGFSIAALENAQETGCDPADDLTALLRGDRSRESLLAHCLEGADADRVDGWNEYVDALVVAAEQTARERGAAAGHADVENVLAEQGLDVVRATLSPGHVDWDEGAINAGAAEIDGVRADELRQAYYEAYRVAARKRAEELAA